MDATARTHNLVYQLAIFAVIAFGLVLSPSAAHGRVFKGRLEVRHSDDFKRNKTTLAYYLRLASGRHLRLDVGGRGMLAQGAAAGRHTRLVPSARVRVTGQLRGRRLLTAAGKIHNTGSPRAKASAVSGPRKVAVFLINFQDDTRHPWTADQTRGTVFTNPDSVNAYYREVSSGSLSLTGKVRSDGDVFGWYTIPKPSGPNCDYSGWADAARAAATAAGNDVTGYDHYIYAFPNVSSCYWAGAYGGGQSWINGPPSVIVVGHELGHYFGLGHASSYNCTQNGDRVSISDTCSMSEYGDPFDVMGNLGTHHPNAHHKVELGALPTSASQTATASGTYTLAPGEQPMPGTTQVLRVPRTRAPDGAVSSYYSLDFRRPFGTYFDNFVSADPAVNGVGIRITSDYGTSVQTKLLDTTPSTPTFADASLQVGSTFTEAATRISIATLSASSPAATVRITFPNVPDSSPPAAPANLAGLAVPDTTLPSDRRRVNLSWSAGSDNWGVTGYRVYRDGAEIGTTTLTTRFSDTYATPRTVHSYRVVAYDAAGNTSAASDPVMVATDDDMSPPTPPSNLAGLAQASTKVSLSWSPSSDNVAVAGYRVYRGGSQIGTPTSTSLVDTAAAPSTTNSYSVVAYDATGNVSPPTDVNVSTVVKCADATGDGLVLVADILAAVRNYGKTPGQAGWNPLADFNGDSRADTADILMAVSQYGTRCTR